MCVEIYSVDMSVCFGKKVEILRGFRLDVDLIKIRLNAMCKLKYKYQREDKRYLVGFT